MKIENFKEEYLLLTDNGMTPPRYVHTSIHEAIAEAEKLFDRTNSRVRILKVVGEVKNQLVPVTEFRKTVTIDKVYDDLPF